MIRKIFGRIVNPLSGFARRSFNVAKVGRLSSFAAAGVGLIGGGLYVKGRIDQRNTTIGENLRWVQHKFSDCQNPETKRGVFDEINIDEFEAEIKQILKDAIPASDSVRGDADLFAIGDTHADYETLIKTVFAAGLINRDGTISTTAKGHKLITLGDIMTNDKIQNQFESGSKALLFVLALHKQLTRNKMKESNILGNHDNDLLYSGEGSMLSEDLLKRYGFKYGQQVGIGRALEKAISKGFFQLSDAEDSRYLSFFHAGLEKTNSVECIEQILIDNQIDVPEELYRRKECRIVGRPVIYEKGKRLELEPIDIRMKVADIRSEDLYRIREDNGIGPECISEFINNKFKTDVISDYSKGEKFLYHKKKEREKQRLYANGKANVDDTFFSTAITDAGRIPPVVLENTPKVTFNNVPVYCIPFKLTATGIMDTRKKMFREYLKNEGSNYDPQNIKPHKEISVNGHEPTFFFKSFFPGERAIQRKGNNIFADFGGGYETYTGSQNGKRDRKGMQGVGFVAVDKDTIFSIEFDHIAKEWRKYELAKLPSREVRAKRLKRIEEGHRANSIKKFMIQFEI